VQDLYLRVQGRGLSSPGIQDLGFRQGVRDLGSRAWGLVCKIYNLGCRV
jgi:hypothetical protein